MAITLEQTIHIARLSRLFFKDEELAKFTKELSRIIDYVDKLKEVKDVKEEMRLEQPCPLRKDIPRAPFPREKALCNAPKKEKGYFVTPKVI
ncbi:MAG TPA: Asp-tRNA(Asn)/Glu-tRNA(Gln) amidotransferase subunit GatC [bacterium (Candidatus Stahlbacteria)]|nr:Asp-tRNA(Asn)/Glu-tRNA(Gln) amidotransferase subunit GatC [Candidatus Stahlbacteria bacterium]